MVFLLSTKIYGMGEQTIKGGVKLVRISLTPTVSRMRAHSNWHWHLNTRAEKSHLPIRRCERAMLRFRRMQSLQKFIAVYAPVYNLFNSECSLYDLSPKFPLAWAVSWG